MSAATQITALESAIEKGVKNRHRKRQDGYFSLAGRNAGGFVEALRSAENGFLRTGILADESQPMATQNDSTCR